MAEFQIKAEELKRLLNNRVYTIVGVEAVKHFKASFQKENQGFTDVTLAPWADISDRRKDQKRKKNGDLPPILTDTGDLQDSITYEAQPAIGVVTISSDLPYAQRHNEGLAGMPKRQFMGPSKVLFDRIENKIDKEVQKILNNV